MPIKEDSTFTARVVASTRAGLISSVLAALCDWGRDYETRASRTEP